MSQGGTILFRALNAGDSVIIQVEDTGPGIPAKRLATIFNPFASTKGKGSWGVGLWSALLHARRTGGELTVDSTEGKGTTFTLRLPKEGAVS
jgi:signal transduction histidine kinase